MRDYSMTLNKLIKTLKTTSITLITLSVISFPSITQANDLERLASSLCESAKTDDRTGMRKKLKSAKIDLFKFKITLKIKVNQPHVQ